MVVVLVLVLTVTITPVLAGQQQWSNNGGGAWTDPDNWSNGIVPQTSSDTAVFGAAISGPSTVSIDGTEIAPSAVVFDSLQPYTITATAGGSLVIGRGGAERISVGADNATHVIAAPITIESQLDLDIDSGSRLVIDGSITQTGGNSSLEKTGPGTLVLAGNNSLQGEIHFLEGTLVIAGDNAFDNENLQLLGSTLIAEGAPRTIANKVVKINRQKFRFDGDQPITFSSTWELHNLKPKDIVVNTTLNLTRVTDPTNGRNFKVTGSGTFNLSLGASGSNVGAHLYYLGSGVMNIYGAGRNGAVSYYSGQGGVVAVGDSFDPTSGTVTPGIGTITITGNGKGFEAQTPGVQLVLDLGQSDYDRLVVGNTSGDNSGNWDSRIVLSDAAANPDGVELQLRLFDGFVPSAGQQFTIVENQDSTSGQIVGTFKDLPEGAVLNVDGYRFVINYTATTVILTHRPDLQINIVAGNQQSAPAGEAFSESLQVRVTDAGGNPRSAVRVVFSAPASGPGLSFPSGNAGVSDADGYVEVPVQANAAVGAYQVTATTTPDQQAQAVFDLSNQAGSPATLSVVAGDNQAVDVNQPFAEALSVLVSDAGGNPVAGVEVQFTAPTSGASAVFPSGDSAVTNAEGLASVNLQANQTAGSYTVAASVTGLSPQNFSLTNNALPAVPEEAPVPSLQPGDLPNATIGSAYAQTIQSISGSAPYRFSVTSGNLPPGLTLSSDGTLNGTPSAVGTYRFTISVVDGAAQSNSRDYALIVERMQLNLPLILGPLP
jgi:autotransporter-associated beta strand protein